MVRVRSSRTGSAHPQTGFSLLEMLVVLALIALVMTAMPVLLSSAIPGARVKSAADRLIADFQAAHRAAIATHHQQLIVMDTAKGWYQSNGETTSLPKGVTMQIKDVPFWARRGDAVEVVFLPDGSSSGALVDLEDKGRDRWISVDWLTGRVDARE